MKSKWRVSVAVLACIFVMACVSAEATTIIPQNSRQLTKSADTIVHGIVTEAYCDFDPDKKMIYTFTKVKIKEDLGKTKTDGDECIIVQIGGRYKGLRTFVPGSARLDVNEEVILFLFEDKLPEVAGKTAPSVPKGYWPASMSVGKISVVADLV
ncbi:hypothetical protein ACFL1X_11075, partial [Candidatus Hydrogenedentota bacterium]